MMKGSDVRHADHPIESLFIDRWSPRAMSGEEIAEADLMVLFEAARWAPSSYNNQPWRILYARRSSEHWPLFLGLLIESNRNWAHRAAALLVFISRTTLERTGAPSITHSFDTGAAWENLALQGWLKGYVCHGMQGFDYVRAKEVLKVPDDFRVDAMAAIGKPAHPDQIPEEVRKREVPSDRRKLAQTVRDGPFHF